MFRETRTPYLLREERIFSANECIRKMRNVRVQIRREVLRGFTQGAKSRV
jgi:hypothetical protein